MTAQRIPARNQSRGRSLPRRAQEESESHEDGQMPLRQEGAEAERADEAGGAPEDSAEENAGGEAERREGERGRRRAPHGEGRERRPQDAEEEPIDASVGAPAVDGIGIEIRVAARGVGLRRQEQLSVLEEVDRRVRPVIDRPSAGREKENQGGVRQGSPAPDFGEEQRRREEESGRERQEERRGTAREEGGGRERDGDPREALQPAEPLDHASECRRLSAFRKAKSESSAAARRRVSPRSAAVTDSRNRADRAARPQASPAAAIRTRAVRFGSSKKRRAAGRSPRRRSAAAKPAADRTPAARDRTGAAPSRHRTADRAKAAPGYPDRAGHPDRESSSLGRKYPKRRAASGIARRNTAASR